MLPLFDMMLQAQNGTAMEAMAKQFNLAQEQVTKAMAALMPAFSSGLKRSTANPYDMSALIAAMTSGDYAKYFEDMGKAFTPQGVADGNNVLQQLFGSKEVSRAIAAQAAQMTGIGQDVLKQMMPAMADALMGGLFKQVTGQMTTASNPFAGTPMGDMVQQWLETSGFAPKKTQPMANMFDNPFTQAMQQMMGMAQPKAEAKPMATQNPMMDNPFVKAFQEMMGGVQPPAPSEKATAPAATAGFGEMMNAMFDSGLEVQKSYQKSMEQILDSYLNAGKEAKSAAPGADEVPGDAKA